MTKEESDFQWFRDNQLHSVDFSKGIIDAKGTKGPTVNRIYYNVGSINPDGYVRMYCNGTLYMQHRLLYWLQYGYLPPTGTEIDHIDSNRSNNAISNLQVLTKGDNNAKGTQKSSSWTSKEEVIQICELLQNTNLSDTAIAEKVGRSRGTVRDIKTRKTRKNISKNYSWKHRGY